MLQIQHCTYTKMIWHHQILIKLFIVNHLVSLSSVTANICQTPRKKAGNCKLISECKELNDILRNRHRTNGEKRYLRNSRCGKQGKELKVCCETIGTPVGCLTPDNDPGQCVNIFKCQPLADLLNVTKFQSKQARSYLRRAACQGDEKHSYCCSGKRPQLNVSSLLPAQCGEDESDADRIFGGEVAGIDQYPWMGLVEYRMGKNKRLSQSCAGSLITKRHVVTAAHCVTGSILILVGEPVNVRLGEFDKSNDGKDCVLVAEDEKECNDEPVVIPIEKCTPHPDFDTKGELKNDIAMIKLAADAPYTKFIRPICLPESDKTLDSGANKLGLFVAGWGKTEAGMASNKKIHLKLPFVDLKTCINAYDYVGAINDILWEKQLCAGGKKGQDSCAGDSGGPLMHFAASKYNLIGVVSYGPEECGEENVPGVYTKVYSYLDWILDQLEL